MREKEFLPAVREKLGINNLNTMQRRMLDLASEGRDIILLSPTGSGKTLAYVLPVLKMLKPASGRVQAVVIAPSRELVLQIASVIRTVAVGYKVTPLYGGHNVEDEKNSLAAGTDIVVATPGRLLDHAVRGNVELLPTRILVLDEFDKSLELGFDDEMSRIAKRLKNVSRTILTSATDLDAIPDYIPLKADAVRLSYLKDNRELRRRIRIHQVESDSRDKLESLLSLLRTLATAEGIGKTIVFVNHRESAERVASFLKSKGVDTALYHGALDQRDREKAIAMFLNGSRPVLVATDLAARGLDIAGVRNVIHYHLPVNQEAWTHRNGRTARVDADGDIFVLTGPEENIPEYIEFDDTYYPAPSESANLRGSVATLFLGAGKKEKISRGDILGFLVKEGGMEPHDVGKIEVRDHYSLVAVKRADARAFASRLSQMKLKGEKRRFYEADI